MTAANAVPAVAPEIDGGSAASAVALLSGALLVLRSRRKK
jgi:LPXTG-motif cell wall-anchored protein